MISLLNSLKTDINNEGESVETSIENSIFSNISVSNSEMIIFTKSGLSKILNTTFNGIDTAALKISKSTFENIERAIFKNTQQGMLLTDSAINNIQNSEFSYCGGSSVQSGGGIKAINSEIKIHQSQFISNTAVRGASISIECDFGQT